MNEIFEAVHLVYRPFSQAMMMAHIIRKKREPTKEQLNRIAFWLMRTRAAIDDALSEINALRHPEEIEEDYEEETEE